MKVVITAVIAIGLLGLAGNAVLAQTGNDLFQQALVKERTEGNMAEAIKIYETIVQKFGSDRKLAARALVQMGQCYEKLGSAEARRTYDRVLREYADQPEFAAQARARLASLNEGVTTTPGMTVRRVWTGPEVPQIFGDVWSKNIGVSPDGRFLVYNDRGLVLREIATGVRRRLTTEEVFSPSVSPDSRQVDGGLKQELRLVSISGEAGNNGSRVLYEAEVVGLKVNDWSPDGKHILAVAATTSGSPRTAWQLPGALQILRISVTDGAAVVLKTLRTKNGWAALAEHSARFSSDGRYVVYDDAQSGSPETDIYFVSSDGSREGPLVEYPGNDFVLGWAPGGDQLLFASERTGTLGAWTVRVVDGMPQGPPELVKRDLGPIAPIGLTRTGAYYYGIRTGKREIYLGTFDAPTGRVLDQRPLTLRSPNFQATPSWSPDGRYLAYTSHPGRGYTETRAVVILAVDTGEERVLHPALTWLLDDNRLKWSPDGQSLVTIALNTQGIANLYQIDVQSGVVSQPLLPDENLSLFFEWSKDGKAIYYIHYDVTPDTAHIRDTADIRVYDLETGRTQILHRPVDSRDSRLHYFDLSPDGSWLAFGSGPADSPALQRTAVQIVPTGGGTPREVFRVESGRSLNLLGWTPDGAHLLFNSMGALWRVAVGGGQPERLGPAMPRPFFHPDGKRVALSVAVVRNANRAAGISRQDGVDGNEEVWVMENFLPAVRPGR